MVRQIIAAAVLMAMGSAGAGIAQETTGPERLSIEGIAAVVNDAPISYSDVRQRARLLLLSLGGQQPSPEQIQQITGQALEQLIDERLQLEKAAEFELEISKSEIDAAIENMARQGGITGSALRQQLLSAGVNPVSLEEQMRAEIAWNQVMGGLYGSRIRISDNQAEDQLDRLKTAMQKTQYRVSEIFLFAPDPASKTQATQAANSIISQLRQGADFRLAAQQISSAPTAATGGDMGWVSLDDLVPEVATAVTAMTEPGLLQPITVENGVYVVLVSDRRAPPEPTTKVDLIRLAATNGSEETLQAALDEIQTCEDVQSIANASSDLRFGDLNDINVDDLGPEGRARVLATEINQPTDIFSSGSGVAVMYVCRREDGADALPSMDDLKSNLKNQELGMISERELRDMRRQATIIYR